MLAFELLGEIVHQSIVEVFAAKMLGERENSGKARGERSSSEPLVAESIMRGLSICPCH